MCFIKRFGNNSAAKEFLDNPTVAEDYIKVYKLLLRCCRTTGNYYSPFRSFAYRRGEHYYQTGKKKFGKRYVKGDVIISTGLHCYKTRKEAEVNRSWNEVLVTMWLPPGTQYYINEYKKLIVADQLVFY